MCFQGFVYFACGHNQVWATNCAQRSDHPFIIQIQCPDYDYASVDYKVQPAELRRYCGIGAYYCAYEQDGTFLNEMHEANNAAQKVLNGVDKGLASLAVIAQRFTKGADERGMSEADRKQHSQYRMITEASADWYRKRQSAQLVALQSMSVIQEAMKWYRERRQHALSAENGSAFRAFVPPIALPPIVSDTLGGNPTVNAVPRAVTASSAATAAAVAGEIPSKPQFLASWQQSPEYARTADPRLSLIHI